MTKKSRQKLKYLENKKSFWGEIKSIFHFQRDFNCQKLSQTWECAFKHTCNFVKKLRSKTIFLSIKLYIRLNHARRHSQFSFSWVNRIYSFNDKKMFLIFVFCPNWTMFKLLVILFIIKFCARNNMH